MNFRHRGKNREERLQLLEEKNGRPLRRREGDGPKELMENETVSFYKDIPAGRVAAGHISSSFCFILGFVTFRPGNRGGMSRHPHAVICWL